MEVLSSLKKQQNINEAVLRVSYRCPNAHSQLTARLPQESKAGLAVGKLRSHADKRVSEAAKEIVKKWKNDVEKAKRTTSGASEHHSPSTSKPGACLAVVGFRQPLTILCSAKETDYFDGHTLQDHLRPTFRLFPCDPKSRDKNRQG